MQPRLLYLVGSALVLSGVGCADATAPQVEAGVHDLAIVVPQLNAPTGTGMRVPGTSAMIQPPDSSGDGGGGVDWNAPTSFLDKWTDAGFATGGTAYSQGYMEFQGTDYDEHTYVYLSYKGAPLDNRDGDESSTFWWPLSSHRVTVNAVITPAGACDYGVSGHTVHHIWNGALNTDGVMVKWQDKTSTTDKPLVSQPPCQAPDTTVVPGSTGSYDDSGDGTGGTIYVICYWTNYYENDVGVCIEFCSFA